MSKRELLLLSLLCCACLLAGIAAPNTSLAIGKTTPTPAPTALPEDFDIDRALEDLLLLLEEKAYDEAIALADGILGSDEESWKAHYYRGFAYERLDKLDEALRDYDAVLNIRPWDNGFWRLRGELHLKQSDPRQAQSDFKRSLFYNPRAQQTYSSLANLHERDVNPAIRDLYRAIVKARRENAQGSSSRAIDTLTEAIESFERGAIPSELGYAHYTRSTFWKGEDKLDEALDDLRLALELQPDMQDYYLARGGVYAETERDQQAGADFYKRMTLLERENIELEIDFGESVTVAMAQGLVARIRFAGEAGQPVTIAARDNLAAGVDPLLALIDSHGDPLTGDDDGGGELDALISGYELPADGDYTLALSHANGGYEGKIRVSLR